MQTDGGGMKKKMRENSNFYQSLVQTVSLRVNRLWDFNRNHIKYADDVLFNTQYNLREE